MDFPYIGKNPTNQTSKLDLNLTLYIKNLKCITGLNVKYKAIIFFIGEKSLRSRLGKSSQTWHHGHYPSKEKLIIWTSLKLKAFDKRQKGLWQKQAAEWENIFTKHITNKGLVSTV